MRPRLVLPLLALLIACAGGRPRPDRRLEMEPMALAARKTPAGVEVEAYDAADLFERAKKALEERRPAAAVADLERLLRELPGSAVERAARYNLGMAREVGGDCRAARAEYAAVSARWPESSDALDALFREAGCAAALGEHADAVALFDRLLARSGLELDDRIEAMARQGEARLAAGDAAAAERTLRACLALAQDEGAEQRLETGFFVAMAQYQLAEIARAEFQAAPVRLPQKQLELDVEEKARRLLVAQGRYIQAIQLREPRWAAAAGFRIAEMFEQMHHALVDAPEPAELSEVARPIYRSEVRKLVRPLLEKAIRVYEKNVLAAERLGVTGEWAARSRTRLEALREVLAQP